VLTLGRTVIVGCCCSLVLFSLNLLLQTHGNFNYVFSITVPMLVTVTVTRHFCALSPFVCGVACVVTFWP
jgi:putative exporter of polyketide antibiotics